MATATRRKTTVRSATAPKRRRGTATANRRAKKSPGKIANFAVPLVFCLGILFCLGFLGLMGYRTVTASGFFDVKKVDVRGVSRVAKDDVEKIVSAQTEKSGVWNADLNEIKARVEKLNFVKSAAVSRILPDGIRVNVVEREPKAVVRLETGDVWADDEATTLGAIGKNEDHPPFALRGWDVSKAVNAQKDNQMRVKLYQKMVDEWQEFELSKRVKELQLSDLDDPKAIVEDSGMNVSIDLGKENFAKRLQRGLEIVVGRGKEIESVNLSGNREVLGFRNGNN